MAPEETAIAIVSESLILSWLSKVKKPDCRQSEQESSDLRFRTIPWQARNCAHSQAVSF
jgi:hypothetical protein